VIDDNFPWLPAFIDHGEAASSLANFKNKVGNLVCSRFTTPDDLAKQVAADLAKIASNVSPDSFGGLLRVNWEVFAPELQSVLATAYANATIDSSTGIVSTRHVIAALATLPNSGQPIVTAFPKVELPSLRPGVKPAELPEMYLYEKPFSSCVLGSMKRLLPKHSPTQQLLALELAVDILKNGHGERPMHERPVLLNVVYKTRTEG